MAIAKLNPIIISVSGRLGNAVFYRRGNRQCVRSYVVPRNPDTPAQRTVRRSFAAAVKSWQQMPAEEKYAYTRRARGLCMSGYNLYISEFITGEKTGRGIYKTAAEAGMFRKDMTSLNRILSVSLPYMFPETVNIKSISNAYG